MQRYAECYVNEVREFIECVRDDKPPSISGQDGRMAVVLGYAAWKSLRENRPVRLSEADTERPIAATDVLDPT
jgi:myo-inositol 2-dehydrogenase/D-chiro-inositol 1-dehydrogenase